MQWMLESGVIVLGLYAQDLSSNPGTGGKKNFSLQLIGHHYESSLTYISLIININNSLMVSHPCSHKKRPN